ncbi:MAG: biotin/lipoyl-binding protein [Ruminococcus sp.]|jgi:methylmalonyl-coA decarboxylase, gamma subunit|nr:biotin/lipoyl-binding protein [Ruminococcus sp.]MDD6300352.1 biotin/lipoyl-binding protein [Ruminococcus sp.]MDD7670488.1 biotin/lipoyl-binding protein [Ruminococcus sp.]MDY2742318.1 biotin/lipoyl-containing protein [Eubacteriales bacterium]CDD02318.1 biotin/lipoyl attachment domain-containing protein [Ruminococcus sp. CAG:382]
MKKYVITVNGAKYEVVVEEADINAKFTKAETPKAAPAAPAAAPKAAAPKAASAGATAVNAPLPGNILKVKATQGSAVKKGDLLCVLEAMKMENEILAPADGTVTAVYAKEGTSVNTGDVLFELA